MLTADVRVDDFDASDWIALGQVFGRPEAGAAATSGGLVLVVEGDRVVKGMSSTRGRLEPGSLKGPLEEVAHAHAVRWALRIERRAVPELADRVARHIARDDDSLRQLSHVSSVVRELCDEGVAETWPRDVRHLPLPTERVFLGGLGAVCGAGKTILMAAFDGAEVVTSLALHRTEHGFDRLVGPSKVRREMGLVSDDWTRNCRGLVRAVELAVGPVSLGCFAQVGTFRELFADTTPGAWSAAIAAREVLFQPMPPALAIPIGVDVGRVAVVAARDLAHRFGIGSWFATDGPLGPAIGRVKDVMHNAEIERLIGFDPAALLRLLFGARER